MPLNCPVELLKVRPAGAAGEIEYEVIAPPVEVLVTVVIALLTVTLCDADESVKAGAGTGVVVGRGFAQSDGKLEIKVDR